MSFGYGFALPRTLGQPGAGGGAVFPLDEVGGVGPVYAYGTNKLRSAYTGSALRVVRPSDLAELDIGFSGAALDEAALSAFIGSEFGRVKTWYDQTGNGWHSTQATLATMPEIATLTIGGSRAMYFNANRLLIPAGAVINRQSMTLYSVVNNNTMGQQCIVQMGSSTNQCSWLVTNSGTRFRYSGNPWPNSLIQPQTKACVGKYQLAPAASAMSQDGESFASSGIAALDMAGGIVGDTALSAGFEGRFYIAALIGYNRIPSGAEDGVMRDSLASAFSTQVVAGRVVFSGDSIVAGSSPAALRYDGFAKQSYPLLSAKISAYNVAGGGNQVQNMIGTYSSSSGAGPILTAFADNRVLLLMVGTNDLTVGARTAVQIYADIQTYAGLVRADGGKIIVSTILPNNVWTAPQQTTRTDLNTLIRTNWATFADGLADFGADATMGPQAAAANTALYPDGLHPSRLGHTYLAPIAAAAINALL